MLLKLSFLLLALVEIANCACFDNGDKEIGGRCFKFVPQKLTFEDARNWCHYQNPVTASYLAYVPNQFTSNFLASYARSAFGSDNGNFWIGISRKASGSPWMWDNGMPVAFTNFGGQIGQNYIAESIINSKWNAFGDNDKNFFVCSYDPAAPPTFAPQTATPSAATPMFMSTQPVPTTTDATLCTPTTPKTFLFAYSMDIASGDLLKTWNEMVTDEISPYISTFANIRFDARNEEDILFHNNLRDLNASVLSHLPDPELGFGDSNIGSDVLKMMDKFLNNKQAPICGSKMFILAKRFPNETEIGGLVAKLRQHHVTVIFTYSLRPTGGQHPETLYNLATQTNGFCAYDYDNNFYYDAWKLEPCKSPFLIYAANPQVSGVGNISLPLMKVSSREYHSFTMTVQDKAPIDHSETVELQWSGIRLSSYGSLKVSGRKSGEYDGNYVTGYELLEQGSYSMSLNYDYMGNIVKTLQIRVYSKEPVSNWIPYDS